MIQQHIDAGISLADALNFLVEKSELVRIERPGFSIQHQSPFISAIDILRARKATGLMQRTGYKAVTCAISENKLSVGYFPFSKRTPVSAGVRWSGRTGNSSSITKDPAAHNWHLMQEHTRTTSTRK